MSFYFHNVMPLSTLKGIVHPKMKITPWFTHPEAILHVYDILLSDVYNLGYIKKCPGSSKFDNGSEWLLDFGSPLKAHLFMITSTMITMLETGL